LDTTTLAKFFPEREVGALKTRVINLWKDGQTKTFSTGLPEHQLKLYDWNEMNTADLDFVCRRDRREAAEKGLREEALEAEKKKAQLELENAKKEELQKVRDLQETLREEENKKNQLELELHKTRAAKKEEKALKKTLAAAVTAEAHRSLKRCKKEAEQQRKCKEAKERKLALELKSLKLRQTFKPRAADKTRNFRRAFNASLSVAPLPESNPPSETLTPPVNPVALKRMKTHCGMCGSEGHNKRKCPIPSNSGGTSCTFQHVLFGCTPWAANRPQQQKVASAFSSSTSNVSSSMGLPNAHTAKEQKERGKLRDKKTLQSSAFRNDRAARAAFHSAAHALVRLASGAKHFD